jgi:hypothetical protein
VRTAILTDKSDIYAPPPRHGGRQPFYCAWGCFRHFLSEGVRRRQKREAKQSGRAGGRIASSLGRFNRIAKSPSGV